MNEHQQQTQTEEDDNNTLNNDITEMIINGELDQREEDDIITAIFCIKFIQK